MNIRGRMLLVVWLAAAAGCAPPAVPPGVPMITEVRREPWKSGYSTGHVLTSRHYRIYTTTNRRLMLTYLPGFMEAAYQQYLKLSGLSGLAAGFSPRRPEPMAIYMMGTRGEWAGLTRSVAGRYAKLYLSIEAGGFCHRGVCVLWDVGGMGTLSVAAHEGLHQFFYHRFRDRLPMWLEESLCVAAEGYRIHNESVTFTPEANPSRFNSLRSTILTGRWIPLEKLLPMDAGDAVGDHTERAVGYYGQLWALAMFLRSGQGPRAGLGRLLADAAAGRLHKAINVSAGALAGLRRRGRVYNRTISDPAFRHYISNDVAGFGRRYYAFARKLAGLGE